MSFSNNLINRVGKLGPLIVFFVGLHSVVLGIVIYFYTEFFYQKFFSANVENIFFVRQSGVFLFLAGLFYLYPLIGLKKLYHILLLLIFSKLVAVLFLISNAKFTLAPAMIYLAAFFDGLMAFLLILTYFNFRRDFAAGKEETARDREVYHDGKMT